MRFVLPLSFLFALMTSTPVNAQSESCLKLPPVGHTVLQLSVTEQRNLEQDTLTANLRIEIESDNAKDVQNKINAAMQEGLAIAKASEGVKISTGGYYVYQYDPSPTPQTYPQERVAAPKPMRWRGSQSIDLQSGNAQSVLEAAGKLQEKGFAIGNLMYILSAERAESVREELMAAALQKLQKQAETAAKALGKKSADILEVSLDGAMPSMPIHMMMKSMDGQAESMAAPVAEPSETQVSLTVSARALLKP